MSIPQTFYLNGPTLATATAVYYDYNLTLLAPDGYYSDGTITRYQQVGSLLPVEPCPTCSVGCGTVGIVASDADFVSYPSAVTKYTLPVNLGASSGSVFIKLTWLAAIANSGFGMMAKIGASSYNLIIDDDGAGTCHKASAGLPSIVSNDPLLSCPSDSLNPFSMIDTYYNPGSLIFEQSGPIVTSTISNAQVSYGSATVFNMYIPKTSLVSEVMDLELYSFSLCDPGAYPPNSYLIEVNCPLSLPSTSISDTPYLESAYACAAVDGTQPVYVAQSTPSLPTITYGNQLFFDANGVTPMDQGWFYYYPDGVTKTAIYVNEYGVITNIVTC